MPQAPTAVLGRTAQAEFPRAFGILSLLKPLARHARGEVYVALRPEGVDRLCVVHLLSAELVERPGVSEGLRAQAGWLVARVHGNLVQTYDVGHGANRLFLLNEYVEGRDLAALLAEAGKRSVTVPVAAAVFVALEVSAAIGFVRSTEERVTGVPTSLVGFSAAGVIASREGTIKVVHQGSSLAPAPETLTEDPGRVSLIAPEHMAGGGSPRGDVFAVGALLWQMLTGRPLAEDAAAHLGKLRAGTFEAPRVSVAAGPDRGIPQALDALVASALAAKPEDRPASCEALRAHLVSVVKGVGGAGGAALRSLMSQLFATALAAEAAELGALAKIAEKELPKLAARPRAATLTNFDPMSKRGASPAASARGGSGLPIGEVIPGSRYRVREKLGEGGMGAVYLAEHVDIERRVALKLVHAELLRNPMVLGQFRQEARAASRIGNPYICDVTDWGELPNGQVFFVMEYLDGRSLGRVLEQSRKLPPARCLPILRQVAKALGSAHEKGIVHLDVKPDNVLLVGKDGRADAVKVVDFGVAGILGQQSGSRVMGTPEYMAPERATGKTYDNRSDVYSLGVMAYEMLVGEVPFQGATPVETLGLQASELPDRINERLRHPIPEALETVVMSMIEKSPARRPQNMAEVEALLLEAQIEAGIRTPWDDLPMPAVAPERAARIARRLRTSLRRTLVLGGITAVAAVSVITAIYQGTKEPGVRVVTKVYSASQSPSIAQLPTAPVATGGAAGSAGTERTDPLAPRASVRIKREDPAEEAGEPRDPQTARQAVQTGRAYADAGRWAEALNEFNRALAADPKSVAALGGLAEVQFELANYDHAAGYAERACRLAKTNKAYFLLLGQASQKIKHWPDALRAYQRVKQLDPKHPNIDEYIETVKAQLAARFPSK